jgi:hypothetical protein
MHAAQRTLFDGNNCIGAGGDRCTCGDSPTGPSSQRIETASAARSGIAINCKGQRRFFGDPFKIARTHRPTVHCRNVNGWQIKIGLYWRCKGSADKIAPAGRTHHCRLGGKCFSLADELRKQLVGAHKRKMLSHPTLLAGAPCVARGRPLLLPRR